jgi:predicted CoA-substrate-specific enzyme activase
MSKSMITAGIDSGSRTVKCILWDGSKIIGKSRVDAGLNPQATAKQVMEEVCAWANVTPAEIQAICATGYGRARINATHRVTEITCHARGLAHYLPTAKSAIEIGGQDSKVLRLGSHGKVEDFAMNDRCAAGTGRFLEVVAARLGCTLEHLGHLAQDSTDPAPISSMCVVFAESEIIGLIAAGAQPGNIVAGVFNAIATRVTALAGRLLTQPTAFTGGVALIPGMQESLTKTCGSRVLIPEDPLYTGALGAAIIAGERSRSL